MANFIALLVARTSALGVAVRRSGLGAARLIAYTSAGAHGCIPQALELAGIGSDALRIVPVDDLFQMDTATLEKLIIADREAGLTPFFIAATAGTVNVGAVDDLRAVAEIAQRQGVWFHVDGAYGALAMLAPEIAPRLAGIQQADSIAFDFHKWGQVPYDAGFILIRNGALQYDTFASPAAYLQREPRGLAAGSPWPCDLGPDLSRGFRALKAWFTIQLYGAKRLGEIIAESCTLARYLQEQIRNEPKLELLAPVSLNIVCFRYRARDADGVNSEIVMALHESGIAAPSTSTINGSLAIRAAIVNHRTTRDDLDALLRATLSLGDSITKNL
jgi:aromatic-L-amino-acid/L-tryptophan decarboxylase